MSDSSEHPALKSFSPTVETVQETGKGALKGALIGALVLGALAFAVPTLLGGILGGIAGGGLLSFLTAPAGAALAGGATSYFGGVTAAAIFGAKLGGVVGGIKGLLGAGEEIEQKKQHLIDNFERNEMRQERRDAMEMRRVAMRQQMQSMGVSPDMGIGHGRSGGMQRA